MMQWTSIEQHKQSREDKIESLSANAQLQCNFVQKPCQKNRKQKKKNNKNNWQHVHTGETQDHKDYPAIGVE